MSLCSRKTKGRTALKGSAVATCGSAPLSTETATLDSTCGQVHAGKPFVCFNGGNLRTLGNSYNGTAAFMYEYSYIKRALGTPTTLCLATDSDADKSLDAANYAPFSQDRTASPFARTEVKVKSLRWL